MKSNTRMAKRVKRQNIERRANVHVIKSCQKRRKRERGNAYLMK